MCVCVCVCEAAKDIGMTIRKGIAVSFLPCFVAFWGFHPYNYVLSKCCFVSVVFWGEEKGMNGV